MSKDTIGLNIPSQTGNIINKDTLLSKINPILTESKILSPDEATNKIISQLNYINNLNVEPEVRSEILEAFQQIITDLHNDLKKRYVNQLQPLSEQKITYIDIAKDMQKAILNGYKIIIENINYMDKSNLKKNVLPKTIYRAFQHFNLLLDIYYQTYTQPAENIWKEMHLIYKYAEECNITEHDIEIDLNSNSAKKSIQSNSITPYKQALFIAINSPYEWRAIEQQKIYNYGELWNEYITIRKIKSSDIEDHPPGIFFIPLNEDRSPYSFALNENLSTNDGATLDVSKLIEYIKKEEKILINDKYSNDTPKDTNLASYGFEKLIKHINGSITRQSQRFNIVGNVFITFGFHATHYYINKKINFTQESIGNSQNLNNIQELELGTSNIEDFTDNNQPMQSFQIEKALYECKLINLHGEGAGIIFETIKFPPIQPIEIIAMTIAVDNNSEINQTHWNIGTIRWLKHNRENQLMAGIEIFAPFAIAAAVQLIKEGNPIGYFQRAFIFFNEHQNKFNLITSNVQFAMDKTVKIYSFYHKQLIETKLQQELIRNNNFKCFSVDINLKKIIT